MNAVSLNNLWNYLQGLSLTRANQRWLGERLIEQASKEMLIPQTEHDSILAGLDTAFKEGKLAREGKLKGRPLAELLNEI